MGKGGLSPIAGKKRFAGVENGRGRYGLFNLSGGVSEGHFLSLNVGAAVGDDKRAVAANRNRVREAMGVDYLLSGHQTHGESIYRLTPSPDSDREVAGYDALITDQIGVGLMIQHADCQAVLLYDPVRETIGAVHSGWRGSVVNLIGKTVAAMGDAFGTDPADLRAVISPSLGACCAEFVNYRAELPEKFWEYGDERDYFDFWAISGMQLAESGLHVEHITLPTTCTSCSNDYFSYRRACRETGGVTGRNCSVVALV